MFLSLLLEVSEETTNLVQLISIIALAVVLVAVAVLCIANKKMDTRSLVYASICIAASFALSFIKISPVQYGGSITLASFVPLLIYAYAFGPVRGLLAGLVYGVLQFVQEPYILTPVTFLLDYLLAFASIALMGFAKKFSKNTLRNVLLGTLIVYVARFAMHLVSGFIYFAEDAIWVDLPQTNAFVYSLIYQLVYVPADCVISMAVLALLVSQKAFDRLLGMMRAKRGNAPAEGNVPAESGTPSAQETSPETGKLSGEQKK